ncbi:MAG: nitrile hydratase subunit beta [Alphaproteobacteria bacterium]
MDGIHDLGGKLGFGPVEVTHDDPPFHQPWEARTFGIARALSRPADWNIDKFRHSRELEEPVSYLTRPYYDQWYKAYACMLVGSGLVTIEELASGRTDGTRPRGFAQPQPASAVASAKFMGANFERPYQERPGFAAGETIRNVNVLTVGHTRLPAYVRDRPGVIAACHGAHVLPDAAHNVDRAEPLYSVGFRLADLFPEQAGSPDMVYLDLWESYLEPAG